jgi:hypothetical protein
MFVLSIGKYFIINYGCVEQCGVGTCFLRRFYYSPCAGSGDGTGYAPPPEIAAPHGGLKKIKNGGRER